MKLTYDELVQRGACSTYCNRFARLFGDAVDVTDELAIRYANHFDWSWAAEELLSVGALRVWEDLARAATRRAVFERKAARLEWHCSRSEKDYQRYTDIVDRTEREYRLTTARAFVRLFNAERAILEQVG